MYSTGVSWPAMGLTLATLIPGTVAVANCPILGFDLPAARQPSTSAAIKMAQANMTAVVNEQIKAQSAVVNSTAFSVEIFSTKEADSLWEYHYSAHADQAGTTHVTKDTIYRIGSVSKLLSMYLWLIEDGDVHWNDPITDFVPELAKAAKTSDGVTHVSWNEVTVGELASHMAGIGRDYSFPGETLIDLGPKAIEQLRLPSLPKDEIPTCGQGESKYLNGFHARRPIFAASKSPMYSNGAFEILGYALENITGRSMEEMFMKDLVKPMNLTGMSYTMPKNGTPAVIPGSDASSWWNYDMGDKTPAGGLYSNSANLSAVGRSILESSRLRPALTRRWLTPRTHTSDIHESVGAPWKMLRVELSNNQLVDLYTKNGGIGAYAAVLILSPDLDFGISILSGGAYGGNIVELFAEVALENFMPALRAAALEQAQADLTGTYSASNVPNTTITISGNANKTGLLVFNWTYNGTQVSEIINAAYGSAAKSPVIVSLYPSGLASDEVNGKRTVYFRALVQPQATSLTGSNGQLILGCESWEALDAITYGSISLDDFAFNLDCSGKADSISPRFLRVTMDKTK